MLAFDIKNGNVCVYQISFQNDSIILVETLLLRISSMISSADFEDSNAPTACLKDVFFVVKSVLTDAVNRAIKSNL